ncbi:hypothetical protein U9M48_042355 [Paspalum notatum var. saurae]|uniref:Uncharacterized protein n=1 Tax=Paspalum notatum var. saurae TaxID=547442 RepID=A0AAQ3USF5_PASNO
MYAARASGSESRQSMKSANGESLTSATARTTSSAKRQRLGSEPPYSSARSLELLHEVAVGAVDLDAVEPGALHGVARGSRRRRRGPRASPAAAAGRTPRRGRRGSSAGARRGRCRRRGGGDAAHVPELAEEDAALGVDGVGDGAPRRRLLGRPHARGVGVALRRGRHARGLRDEEAAAGGALRVVDGGVRLRHVAVGALPRQRRQHHAVRELEIAHLVGRQQRDAAAIAGHGLRLRRSSHLKLLHAADDISAASLRVMTD